MHAAEPRWKEVFRRGIVDGLKDAAASLDSGPPEGRVAVRVCGLDRAGTRVNWGQALSMVVRKSSKAWWVRVVSPVALRSMRRPRMTARTTWPAFLASKRVQTNSSQSQPRRDHSASVWIDNTRLSV